MRNVAGSVEAVWFGAIPKWLNRRSQRKSFNWEEFKERLKRYHLPRPGIVKGYTWIYAAGA
ncbi:MAG: hypothetical protein WA098_06080 [Smithella sp.]